MKKTGFVLLFILGALLLAVVIFSGGKQLQTTRSDIGGPFSLTAGNGKALSEKSFAGKYLLIYFGFTHCPDVCPTTLSTLMAAVKQMGRRGGDVQALFITVDPERDTPAVIGAYAEAFSTEGGPSLIGLTGAPEEIATVEREYKVYAEKHPTTGNDYVMDHSSVIYMMAPDGHFIAAVNGDQPAGAMASEIKKHLNGE